MTQGEIIAALFISAVPIAIWALYPKHNPLIGETAMRATIAPLGNDRFGLYADGELVGSYARARDARRGATRRGYVIA